MAVRRRATWSSNEYFAHKKNIGEEVKLRNTITTIEKVLNLSKDSMRFQLGEVRTSLKNLRKSTGHSIEALPPTPFQNYSGTPSLLPLAAKATCVSHENLPPELQYLENDNDIPSNFLFDENCDNDEKNKYLRVNESFTITPLKNNNQENQTFTDIDTRNQSINEGINLTHLPALTDIKDNIDVRSAGNCGICHNGDDDKNREPPRITKLPIVIDGKSVVESDQGNNRKGQRYDIQHVQEETSYMNCVQHCLISEPTQLAMTSSDWRTQIAKERKTINVSKRPSGNKKAGSRALLQKRKGDNRDSFLSFRDIRNRCRTCLERFRQNAEFQKLKREMEDKEAFQNRKEDKSIRDNLLPPKDPFMSSTLDLVSILSDEVLDFDDKYVSMPTSNPNYRTLRQNKCAKKGYSRERLDQLAEPRGGRKRRLFSKQLIKKEADILIESHAQPQLTDKEKERLRMIESKIRMFLAMMQNSVVPTTMVDIPQREDIMKVDISHH